MVEVMRMSIITLVFYFVAYIIIHVMIMMNYKKTKNTYEHNPTPENEQKMKKMEVAFKWFPALYCIFVVAILYF